MKPIERLRYTKEKAAVLDSLPVGSVIVIKTFSDIEYECRKYYIKKQGPDDYREKCEHVLSNGRYGSTKYDAERVLRMVIADIGGLICGTDNISIKISLEK